MINLSIVGMGHEGGTYLKKDLSAPGYVAKRLLGLIRPTAGLRFFVALCLASYPNLFLR
jgi:hypothetical protein